MASIAGLWRANVKNSASYANIEKALVQEVVKADLRVKSCIQDIQDGCESQEELNVKNLEAGESMRTLKKALENLRVFAMEQDKVEEKERLTREVESHTLGMKRNTEALRKANLTVQKHIEARYRDSLLSGGSQVKQRGRADKETLLRSTTGMTESLFSVSRMMADQVKHSENALEMLDLLGASKVGASRLGSPATPQPITTTK
ncbi:vesicle transport protein SEC20 isoform X2 [Ixodes scapularis]|uniref:vesicle transport protein SEC20 isoform X2 n=1 Tax=Ixodes scapularis TaxID=6945 RepID=UPI001A9F9336|nr:vesicle transport protein SEC20 isoform X2 [Ixodes scapularis]